MYRLFHWVAHKFGANTGDVEVSWVGNRLMAGFRCDGCGQLGLVSFTGITRPDLRPEDHGLPPYPTGDVAGACVCGSWPGGKCLRCPVIPTPKATP
jgi:hypothetical protein